MSKSIFEASRAELLDIVACLVVKAGGLVEITRRDVMTLSDVAIIEEHPVDTLSSTVAYLRVVQK